MTCDDDVRMSLGVYILGALDDDEVAEVEAHLDGCPECRAELAELSGLPPVLALVSEDDIRHAAAPPRAVLDRLVATSVRRSRWSRALLALAASIVVAALGGTAWLAVDRGAGDTVSTASSGEVAAARPSTPTAAAASGAGDVAAPKIASDAPQVEASRATVRREVTQGDIRLGVRLTTETGGTKVVAWVRGVPGGIVCRLWAIGRDGTRSPAGSWEVPPGGYRPGQWYDGVTELPMGQIARFELSTSDGGLVKLDV
ncbi:anti-sigma factor family protein [Planotetraspora kaengkrachanensis]|uniref:Anti-sigma factor n=1 Tax=Planotetraspora kaengkrachanensis TaxID=575193 RepID=A0A8J3VBM2_9ACTN|nr:zf-HC2 domain-containing protein [Planotetraspora kaengkrachanensis]GIG83729.1 anti-sigma factor [Planotetraspora kaengkrachanensis]